MNKISFVAALALAVVASACGPSAGQRTTTVRGVSRTGLVSTVTIPTGTTQSLLLPGRHVTLVIAISPAKVDVIVASGDTGGSNPSLPTGFTPASARVVGDTFYLLGEQCAGDDAGACPASLIRTAEPDIRWERVPLDQRSGDDPSLVDPGEVAGSFYLAPGSVTGPALLILESDDSWTAVDWPEQIKQRPIFSCSTHGEVYLFGWPGPRAGATEGSGPSTTTAPPTLPPPVAFALDADRTWTPIPIGGDWPGKSRGATTDPTLCSEGSVLIGNQDGLPGWRITAGSAGKPTSTIVGASGIVAGPGPEPLPRVASIKGTADVMTGRGPEHPTVPPGSSVLASAEVGHTLTILLREPDGSARLDTVEEAR